MTAPLLCPWCAGPPVDAACVRCAACGEPVPPRPALGPAPQPPPAPRSVGARFQRQVLRPTSVQFGFAASVFGALFFVPGVVLSAVGALWALGFVAIGVACALGGLVLVRSGRARAASRLAPFERGEVVPAHIVSLTQDKSVTRGGDDAYLWLIDYGVALDGVASRGLARGFGPWHAYRKPGDVLWLLVDARDRSRREFWPPIDEA